MSTLNIRHIRKPMEKTFDILGNKNIKLILPNDSNGFYVRVEKEFNTKNYISQILNEFDYLSIFNVLTEKDYLEIVFETKKVPVI